MNLRKALGRERRTDEDDLNITPVMNIFLILVPFLLLTAVFVKIAILEFALPTADSASKTAQAQNALPVVTILAITDRGFELESKGMKFGLIAKKAGRFDFQTLVGRLREIKTRYQQTEDIILAPQASIKYNTIIKVMDRCRENGFFNISISG